MKRCIFLIAFLTPLLAQTTATVTDIGYNARGPLQLAPGQVATLFVTGLKTVLGGPSFRVAANMLPLPTTLAGFSVQLHQLPDDTVTPAVLLAVEQMNLCTARTTAALPPPPTLPPVVSPLPVPECVTTALTIQVPYNLAPGTGGEGPPLIQRYAELLVIENGATSRAFAVHNTPDQVHLLRTCDINGSERGTGVCGAVIAHGNGTLVRQDARAAGQPKLTDFEAHPGETLMMYAYGLGTVSPAVKEGAGAPASPPATTLVPLTVTSEYRPLQFSAAMVTQPIRAGGVPMDVRFAGLAPGWAGLYQINIVVPAPPPGTPPCGGLGGQTNFTIYVQGPASSDAVSICVDPGSDSRM